MSGQRGAEASGEHQCPNDDDGEKDGRGEKATAQARLLCERDGVALGGRAGGHVDLNGARDRIAGEGTLALGVDAEGERLSALELRALGFDHVLEGTVGVARGDADTSRSVATVRGRDDERRLGAAENDLGGDRDRQFVVRCNLDVGRERADLTVLVVDLDRELIQPGRCLAGQRDFELDVGGLTGEQRYDEWT